MKTVPKRRSSLEARRARYGYLFVLPFVIGLLCLFLPNMIKTILYSVNETVIVAGGYTLEWYGFGYYYKALFVDADFIQYLVSSLGQMLVQVPTIVIFSLFMATLLNQKFHGRVLARAIFFLPVILATGIISKVEASIDISALMMTRDALDTGDQVTTTVVTQLLSSLNFNKTLTDIVVSAADGVYEIVNASGMQIFIFLAAFQEIPLSLYEAARVEGCSSWELFWKIIIPTVSRQIAVAAVYTVIDTFTRSDSALFEYIYETAFTNNQYSFATSMYLLYSVGLGAMLGIAFFVVWRMRGGKEREAL